MLPARMHILSYPDTHTYHPLPLRLLTPHKLLQNPHTLLQTHQPSIQLLIHPLLIIPQFGIKVFPVRRRAHRGAENRLDDEAVVRFERVAVGVAEGVGEFFGLVGEVVAEALGGEVEAAVMRRGLVGGMWDGVGWGRGYRVSQRSPSVAVCFFAFSSLRTRSCRFSESTGASSWRSRTFCHATVSAQATTTIQAVYVP